MAKKQIRRSVSLNKALYDQLVARAKKLERSMSDYISILIRKDLESAGFTVATTRHRGRSHTQFSERTNSERIADDSLAKELAEVRVKWKSPSELAYEKALEFQREKLERRGTSRELCGSGGCNLMKGHCGVHRGACGCIGGCAAWDCPNA